MWVWKYTFSRQDIEIKHLILCNLMPYLPNSSLKDVSLLTTGLFRLIILWNDRILQLIWIHMVNISCKYLSTITLNETTCPINESIIGRCLI